MTQAPDQFPVSNQCIYLNHAAVAPWPRVTQEAVKRFADDNLYNGSLNYPKWLETEQRLRERAARLINAEQTDEIALVKNTSEGISFVAQGIQWTAGENVVGIKQEFPSNRFAWQALEAQGIEFRTLDLDALDDEPEDALMQLCDENTRVLAISAVQFANGLKLDLAKLGQFCQRHGILFCVDAIQQLGVMPLDVQQANADFLIADGHKWMLGPEGIGIFYVRRRVLEQLKLTQFGWHMAEKIGDYTTSDFTPAASARRFEAGSPNMLGIHALEASLGLIEKTHITTIAADVTKHIEILFQGLSSDINIEVISDMRAERRSGIITFRLRRGNTGALFQHLQNKKIFCAPRGGGIRLAPHFYTPDDQIDTALGEILARSNAC